VYRIGGILERVRKLRTLHDPRAAEFCRKQKFLYLFRAHHEVAPASDDLEAGAVRR
jgi:hypothetical protein